MATLELSERLLVTEAVVSCTRCELHDVSSGPVAFSGPAPTAVCVLGEAPGQQEDEQGAPFVGPSGKLLREHLAGVGFDVEQIAFVNTVSCWPKGTPDWKHLEACEVNKQAQLDVVDPSFVLCVGKVPVKGMDRRIEIKYGRGRPWLVDGRVFFATYHPAAALRNGLYEKTMHEDLETFKTVVDAGPERWADFAGYKCFACNNPLFWVDESGLAWCETHQPPEGEVRKRLLEREHQDACRRVAAVNGR